MVQSDQEEIQSVEEMVLFDQRQWQWFNQRKQVRASQASSSPSLLTQIVPDESLPSHRGFFPPNNQHSEQLPVWRKRGEVYREWLSRLSIRIFKSFCFLTGRTSVSLETRIKGIKCWVPIAQGRGVPHVTLDKRLTGARDKKCKIVAAAISSQPDVL